MTALHSSARPMLEVLETKPAVNVPTAEYWRLLGYPPDHSPGERACELADATRRWFAEYGQPWIYLREAELQVSGPVLRLDGVAFPSLRLNEHFRQAGAERAMLLAVSAGASCEARAQQLWLEGRPDEYFFTEVFGSAVVEHLVATASGRICERAERGGWVAVPHYSPGYTGWDIADQGRLFELITRRRGLEWPEPLEVLSSGMLRPKKSLLAVVGLAPRGDRAAEATRAVPCEQCALAPCQYRRRAYRHTMAAAPGVPVPALAAPTRDAEVRYTVNPRALAKWATERVRLAIRDDGSLEATFRFDGTTCSNQGRPLAFDYQVILAAPEPGAVVLSADCRPAPGDEGHRSMCAYLQDPTGVMTAIASDRPPLGRPLSATLNWPRALAPAGCYCDASSRLHKWGLALEAIHYALAQAPVAAPSDLLARPS